MTKTYLIIIFAISFLIIGCTSQNPNVYEYKPKWDKEEIQGIRLLDSEIHSAIKDNEQLIFVKTKLENITNENMNDFTVNIEYPKNWPKAKISQTKLKISPPYLPPNEWRILSFVRTHEIHKNKDIIPLKELHSISVWVSYNTVPNRFYDIGFHQSK